MGWHEIVGWVVRSLRVVLRRKERSVLVVPCTTTGSLGDQAMLDVLVENLVTNGYRVRFLEYGRPYFNLRHKVEIADLSQLPSRSAKAVKALGQLLLVDDCAYLGADVINDRYSTTAQHLEFLRVAQAAGVRVHIQGFSLEKETGPKTSAQLNALRNADFLLRDPQSFENSDVFKLQKRRLVADMAFLLRPELKSEDGQRLVDRIKLWTEQGCFVLGVNMSGPTMKLIPGGAATVSEALSSWLASSEANRIVFLSHDTRPGDAGDTDSVTKIRNLLLPDFHDRLASLDDGCSAWELKEVCGSLHLVMTGRMHLAIASMGMTTPVLCLAYMGKFNGLMKHFKIDGMVLDPSTISGPNAMAEKLADLQSRTGSLRSGIAEKLPEIRRLALENFHWVR